MLLFRRTPGGSVSSAITESALAANFGLQIIQPQSSLDTKSRFYKAYPGLLYDPCVAVTGGMYPYKFYLDAGPSGMSINIYSGRITWSNPTTSGSPHSITVRVVDMWGTQVTVSWTLTVTTTGFLFFDSVNGNDSTGAGTLASPWKTLNKIWVDVNDTTYEGQFMYFRVGTYDVPTPTGYTGDTASGSERVHWRGKPRVFLAYPGESVTINQLISGTYRHFYIESSTYFDQYFGGLTFDSGKGWCCEVWGTQRAYWLDCTFQNLTSDGTSANQGAIGIRNDADTTPRPPSTYTSFKRYFAVVNCTFNNISSNAEGIGTYGIKDMLIADNVFTNINQWAIDLKSTTMDVTIRKNTFGSGMIRAYDQKSQYYTANVEFCFNYALSEVRCGEYSGTGGGPLTTYFYRNTIVSAFVFRELNSDDGPLYRLRNVIVNDSPADHIDDTESVTVSGVTFVTTENLMGLTTDGIVDGSGNLAGAYASNVGSRGWQLGTF